MGDDKALERDVTPTQAVETGNDIQDTDIVFACPACGKSLAIDYRGAGLNLTCPHCGNECAVPIPEGMELSDLDSTPEEQEIRILNLRKLLEEAEHHIESLNAQVAELTARCEAMQQVQGSADEGAGVIREKVAIIQRAQADIYRALDAVTDVVGESD